MCANRTDMGFSGCDITEFHLLFRFLHKEVAALNNIFMRSKLTYMIFSDRAITDFHALLIFSSIEAAAFSAEFISSLDALTHVFQ